MSQCDRPQFRIITAPRFTYATCMNSSKKIVEQDRSWTYATHIQFKNIQKTIQNSGVTVSPLSAFCDHYCHTCNHTQRPGRHKLVHGISHFLVDDFVAQPFDAQIGGHIATRARCDLSTTCWPTSSSVVARPGYGTPLATSPCTSNPLATMFGSATVRPS